jgi:hypothetical protein
MVDHLSQYGDCLGSVNGHTFHKFPTLEQLAAADEATLRKAGFGYRAKFIEGTVKVGSTLGFTIWNDFVENWGILNGELWIQNMHNCLDTPKQIHAFKTKPDTLMKNEFNQTMEMLRCVWCIQGQGVWRQVRLRHRLLVYVSCPGHFIVV